MTRRSADSAAPYVRDHRGHYEAIVGRWGHLAGHMTPLGPDPWRCLFSASGDSAAAFLEYRHVIVGWRSPVGPESERAEMFHALRQYARERRAGLLVLEVDGASLPAAAAAQLRPLWIGSETFISLPTWSLEGSSRQKIRLARNFAQRHGVTWREVSLSEDTAMALAHLEESWKAERKERRNDSFLRNDYRDLSPWRRYFVAELAGSFVASATCTQISQTSWYLQDIVRRPDAPRGALEGAMAIALDTLRDEGYLEASNGPMAFWRPGDRHAATHELGIVARRAFSLFERQFRFDGINQFRSKFVPDRVESMYAVRSSRLEGPRVISGLIHVLNNRLPD